jgi:hypothetical protein
MLSVFAASVPSFSTDSVSALPLSATGGVAILTTQLDQALPTVQVRNNGGAVAAGVIGGMILGGIIATQAPYYGNVPYGYYPPGPAYQPYPMGGDAVAYCMRRFRSYDPSSMTYVGYDGLRHPCP